MVSVSLREIALFVHLVDRFSTLSYNYPIIPRESNHTEFAINLIERLNNTSYVDIYDVLWSLSGNDSYYSESAKLGYIQELEANNVGPKIEHAWTDFVRDMEG